MQAAWRLIPQSMSFVMQLRSLRNAAAHGKAEVSKSDALRFRDLAESLTAFIDKEVARKRPEKTPAPAES
jgi:hypothetical protein